MSSSVKENQDQRKFTGMEDSSVTIEYLRARLLAERSVSRTARHRADELAQRVVKLEEQLKIVSLQRKKAERATTAVLSILENSGITDGSEEFDSDSDQDAIFSDSRDTDDKTEGKATSSSLKEKENDANTLSSSEIESSPSTGRSLSWKSGKDSSHSLDRKKSTDCARRRCSSFASTGICSAKQVGKSCRQIRRRDTRSTLELKNSSVECASKVLPSSPSNRTQSLVNCAVNSDLQEKLHDPASGMSENQRQGDESAEEIERGLQREAHLLVQYEAEEKAQREWEEKYKENNSYALDSCHPGNYSDVTEERDEMKTSQQPYSTGTTDSQNHSSKHGASDDVSTEETGAANNVPSPRVNMGCLKHPKCSKVINSESQASEFAFPMSNGNCSENHGQTSAYSHHQSMPVNTSVKHRSENFTLPSGVSCLQAGQASGGVYELASVFSNTSSNVGSVLEALEQAKLSMKHRSPLVKGYSPMKTIENSIPTARTEDRLEIPVGCPGLFRLPTDFQPEATTTASYTGSDSRFSSANYAPELAFNNISACPNIESGSNAATEHRISSLSSRPFQEFGSGVTSKRPVFETTLDAGLPYSVKFNCLSPHSTLGLPFSSKTTCPTYPFSPSVVPKLSSSEAFLTPPMNETGLPPSVPILHYNAHIKNMYSS